STARSVPDVDQRVARRAGVRRSHRRHREDEYTYDHLRIVSQVPKYASLDRPSGALADPTRRSILQLVSTRPASISELARPIGIALPTVLEHVRILEETRLLTTEKVGRVRECRLGPER